MDLQQLKSFVAVAEQASFTRGAQVLGLAQPALSRHIRSLEVELRQTLLTRNGRGAVTTDAGKLLLEHARGILHQVARAHEDLDQLRGGMSGRVALGLPHEMVYRHPFPGPGLGVRILGEVKKSYADLLRRADAIFIEELRATLDSATGKSWYDLTSQAFTVFLPVKSVGVMGDGRTYDYVVALRAVQTSDFMTADWAELPYALLKKVSSRIINEVRGINRVTYDVSSKPPATIEWE